MNTNSNILPSENKVFIDKWYLYLYNYFVTVTACRTVKSSEKA